MKKGSGMNNAASELDASSIASSHCDCVDKAKSYRLLDRRSVGSLPPHRCDNCATSTTKTGREQGLSTGFPGAQRARLIDCTTDLSANDAFGGVCVFGGAMRASSLWVMAHLFIASPALAESAAVSPASAASPDISANCRIPFETLKDSKTGQPFPLSAALNENARLPENLRQRYVVADLNTTNENGYCRGIREFFSPLDELSEFPRLRAIAAVRGIDVAALAKESVKSLLIEPSDDPAGVAVELEDLNNYLQQVHRYRTEPVLKPAVTNGYCIGQTLNLCEIVNGQPRLVIRLVTSSGGWRPPLYSYYAPINIIKSRSWSSDRRYTPTDARRDARMGGGSARIVPFANDGDPIEMPSFMHFVPADGYPGERANGIHQIAGGLDSGDMNTFGAPVSPGCFRLLPFQSKLARWWTPTQAKLFIHFEPDRYRTFGIAATGKAREFAASHDARNAAAARNVRPAVRTAVSRPERRPANRPDTPFSFSFPH